MLHMRIAQIRQQEIAGWGELVLVCRNRESDTHGVSNWLRLSEPNHLQVLVREHFEFQWRSGVNES